MRAKTIPPVAVFGITVLHLCMLGLFQQPAYDSPDAHGYFMQARIIAETGQTGIQEESPVQQVGMHWLETEKGQFYSRYPTGLPFIIAIVYKLFGPEATIWINIVLTSFTLPILYYMVRRWTSPTMGLVAMCILAINPSFNQYALNADSHASTLFFLLAGLAGIAKWEDSGKLFWAVVGGFLLGYIPIIRYPEVLFGIGIATYLLLKFKKNPKELRGIIAASISAGVPIAYAMIRNWAIFGAPWRTAYALTNEQTGFSREYFTSNYSGYLDNLSTTGLGPVFILGLLGLAALINNKHTRDWGIMLLVVVIPTTLLYMAYYFGNGSAMTMRFLLPTFPVYVVAACYLIHELSKNWKINAAWIGIGVVVFSSLTAIPRSLRQLANEATGIRSSAYTIDELDKMIPDGSVVFLGRQTSQWADFATNWKVADESLLSPGNRMMGMNRPAFGPEDEEEARPSPRQVDRRVDVMQRYANLSPEEKMDLVMDDALAWAGTENDVYVIANQTSIQQYTRILHPDYDWQLTGEINIEEGNPQDWIYKLANSFQDAGGRGRQGPGGPGGGRPTNQRMMPTNQDRMDMPPPNQNPQRGGFRPIRGDNQRNQRTAMNRQLPGVPNQTRRSPFEAQTTGTISLYKLVERNGES